MRGLVILLSLSGLLASACAQPSPDAAVSPAPDVAPPPVEEPAPPADGPAPAADCASLAPEDCEAAEGCSTIRGLSAEDIEQLKNPDPAFSGAVGSILGCTSSEQGCKEVETAAKAGPGEPCYLFGDSCVPEGWQPCKMKVELD